MITGNRKLYTAQPASLPLRNLVMVSVVTGAPGWLGSRLLKRLSERRVAVRAFVERGIDASPVRQVTDDLWTGDVRDPASVRQAFAGADTVFHCAAALHPSRIADFYSVNTEGTRHVVEACLSGGVKRLIHVSSNAACGTSREGNRAMIEEDIPRPITPYGRSKYLAEQIVLSAYEDHGLKTTIIRPCGMYGPGQPTRKEGLMRLVSCGKAPLVGDGRNRMSMTYIDHAVEGILLAHGSKNAIGQTYFIADERPYSTYEIYSSIATALGVELRVVRLPAVSSRIAGHLGHLIGRTGIFSSKLNSLHELGQEITCSITKAKRELGYRPTMILEEGMKGAVSWSRAHGSL